MRPEHAETARWAQASRLLAENTVAVLNDYVFAGPAKCPPCHCNIFTLPGVACLGSGLSGTADAGTPPQAIVPAAGAGGSVKHTDRLVDEILASLAKGEADVASTSVACEGNGWLDVDVVPITNRSPYLVARMTALLRGESEANWPVEGRPVVPIESEATWPSKEVVPIESEANWPSKEVVPITYQPRSYVVAMDKALRDLTAERRSQEVVQQTM